MIIEVWTKDKYSSSEEAGLAAKLSHAGLALKGGTRVRVSRLYNVEAPWPRAVMEKAAETLLTDKITEHWSLSGRPALKGYSKVSVWLKPSVTDVVGESVKEAVHGQLGDTPRAVRFGRAYYARCSSAEALRLAVAKTLANEVVHAVTIENGK